MRIELLAFSFLSFFLLGIGYVTQQLMMATSTTKYIKGNDEEERRIDKPDKNTLILLNEQRISRNNRQCQLITTDSQRKKRCQTK